MVDLIPLIMLLYLKSSITGIDFTKKIMPIVVSPT